MVSSSQKRLNEFLQKKSNIQDIDAPKNIDMINEISFNHVDFTFEHTGIQAIKDLQLTIKKGQRIAIMGKTGCGKTTLAQLIMRMMDVDAGNIKVNGEDIRHVNLEQLRSLISYVPQDVFLFSDTIENNIAFGMENSDTEFVTASAKAAVIDQEIEKLSQKYKTSIGERGVTLSGGQKQRISIARALSRPSELFIFDDCISAVDTKTEQKIAENLAGYLKNKTAIFNTHRIIHAIQFDQIVVLHDGAIIQSGSHAELLSKEGYYKDLYLHQQHSGGTD